jgi:hypothetical protein
VKPNRHCILGIVFVLLAFGCASTDRVWEEVRRQDTPGAYHRFLRANPEAPQVQEARERLAYTRLRKKPTVEGYAEFRVAYPQSPLLAEVQPIVEAKAFEQARSRSTVSSYREFLADFPDGPNAARAAGNAEYLEKRGFAGRPSDLAAFAARHPASDFATEAGRSATSVDARRRSSFRRVGLVVEIAPETPGAGRLARSFAERARRHYAQTPLELVPLAGAGDPNAARLDALLTIRHREELVKAEIGVDRTTTPGVLATTNVTLVRKDEPRPIWSDEFSYKVSVSEHRDNESVLFGAASKRYWETFHLPVATWNTQLAVRTPFAFPKPVVAVEAVDHRAVALFEDGNFQVVDLSDPAAPQVVGHYRRPQDLTKWSDLRFIDGRIVIFGEDGLEIVDLASETPRRLRALDRAKVGSIIAVEKVPAGLLVAGNRGLLLVKGGAAEPQLLIEQNVLGAAMRGDRVLFTDGDSLFVASIPTLLAQRADGKLRIGTGFAPNRIRVRGPNAVVLGERGVLLVDVSNPRNPRLRSRVSSLAVGEVRDALAVRGRLFLLGERGLQISDASGGRFDDSADVSARLRLSAAGRHLVLVGDGGLQVVDTTPFVVPPSLASPRP